MPPKGIETRLDDMRRAEYGSTGEMVIRYLIMISVVVVLAFVIDHRIALTWGLVYLGSESATALFLHTKVIARPRLRYALALGFYVMSNLVFMTLPLYLIAADFSPALTYIAAAGIIGLPLYTLQRVQRESSLMIADSFLVTVMATALVAIMFHKVDDWADRLTVLLISLAVTGYYIGSLVTNWRQQHDLREAQHRYAAAQKARALGQFAGGVAHDFNNQLTAILGNLDLFEQLDNESDRRAALNDCRAAAERAAMTVQQLLATTGRTRLSPAPLDMEGFVFDLAEILADLLEQDMQVEVIRPDEPLMALVDRDMLETCAIQLCLNAQDATGGTGTIRIRADIRVTLPERAPQTETAPPFVVLIIEDDGPGVTEDAIPLLVEPFYTTKGPAEGQGLGLAAVSGFAKQSGGALLLEKSLFGGLAAQIYLPQAPNSHVFPP